ncbi:MAG TPA: hypothetical protein VGM23_16900 [Armatimonadota bacterium]
MRIYPVPFRRLEEEQQYKKFDWIECDLVQSRSDPRPESRNPVDLQQFVPVGHIGTEHNWRERRRLLLRTAPVYTRLKTLIEAAKANKLSLATFKPTRITSFTWEPEEREWDAAKLAAMRQQSQQGDLFDEESWRKTFQIIPKLPYSFSYRYEDADGQSSEMQILDWEIGALYWNCWRRADGNEEVALQKVREKYVDQFSRTDLHFFLGTTQHFHFRAPNPWVIIGVFPIPYEQQATLF